MKILLLAPLTLFSLYMNNPAAPEMAETGIFSKSQSVAFSVGYESDFIFRRAMKLENRREDERAHLSHLDYDTYFGVIQLNLFDRIDIYTGLGSTQFSVTRRPLPGTTLHYESSNDFAWTVGGSSTLFFIDDFSCGVNANYLTTSPSPKMILQNGSDLSLPGARLHFSEWQVGIGVSYIAQLLVPYLGVAFSSARLRITNPIDVSQLNFSFRNEDFKSDDTASIVIGLGASHETFWEANIEARFIGETAFSFSTSIRL
jgi:hypothetical protein